MTKNQIRLRAMNRQVWLKRHRAIIILITFLIASALATTYSINLIMKRRECQMWIDNGLIREQWQADHCESLKVIQ